MDTMSMQKAKAEFQSVKMEGGDIDTYIAKFERLMRLARYDLQNQMVLNMFGSGITSGLYVTIINGPDETRNWTEWDPCCTEIPAEILAHLSNLGMRGPKDSKSCRKPQTAEQWKAAWKNKGANHPDTMDTTPGWTRARKINTDERTELMKCYELTPIFFLFTLPSFYLVM